MTESEMIQAVICINGDLFDQGFNDGEVELRYSTDGYVVLIDFLGCRMYNSDVDSWEDGFSTFEEFIRTRVNELVNHIKEIQV